MFILVVLGSLFVAGCGSKQGSTPPPLPPSGTWEILLFRDQEGKSPIMVRQVWMGNEILFMIIPNFKSAGGGGGSGGTSDRVRFHGEFYLPDGKTELSFRAETVEGEVKSVTIADMSYDLEDGRLFFVSLNGEVSVRQIYQDTRHLTPQHEEPKQIEEFLEGIPGLAHTTCLFQ